MDYIVYILYSALIDKFYVGYTNNIERRLKEHNRRKGKYTDRGIPWALSYTESFSSKTEAMTRESEIKSKKSRSYIENLIKAKQ